MEKPVSGRAYRISPTIPNPFAIGTHHPVYLWAGPGTVRMNRLKFMDAPVNETVHTEAHTEVGAQRMAQEAAFTWAYLMYNWGFPPEVEQEDWTDFRRAVEIYQAAGMRVFGYVQVSNCVYDGSFCDKEWYAHDPQGRPFYYYTGRYMTCWSHPGWREHLQDIVRGIVEAGADGVFFDNLWHGCQPLDFGGTWMGPAGCYCSRCQAAFRQVAGFDIPTSIDPATDEASRRYLRWRAWKVTATLATLSDYARSLNPEVVIGANNFDAVMRPSYLIYGIDLCALARVQDVIMIEDYGLPRWQDRGDGRSLLINNALTLRTARALVGDTALSTDPYDQGIGFDGVYATRRFRQGIAEAAACGASMVVKGTEYVEDGEFTLLTAERFAPQRAAIGAIHRWLADHAGLYHDRRNAAPVGLFYPGDALWQDWNRLAALYFGIGQALLAAGIPWRVVAHDGEGAVDGGLAGLKVLLCLGEAPAGSALPPSLQVVPVPDLAGWAPRPPSFLGRHKAAHGLASGVVGWLFQAYFRHRWARQLADTLGLVHFFWQTPFFRLPPAPAREALLAAVDEWPHPRVTAADPVLVELWQQDDMHQLHLVNYAAAPQSIQVNLGHAVQGRILSPDRPPQDEDGVGFHAASLELDLDVYTVLEYRL